MRLLRQTTDHTDKTRITETKTVSHLNKNSPAIAIYFCYNLS